MNSKRIALGIGIAILFAVLTVSTASAEVTVYLDPQDGSVSGHGDTTEVKVMFNITGSDTARQGQIGIKYDQSCVNIIDVEFGPKTFAMFTDWNSTAWPHCWGYGYDLFRYWFSSGSETGVVELCTLTVQCNSTEYCKTSINFTCGADDCYECPMQLCDANNVNLYPDNVALVNGTFTCGTPPPPPQNTK